jgi:hypothetical protein
VAVVHGLRGRRSNRAVAAAVQREVLSLYRSRYAGFGPTLAAEYLGNKHGIEASKETVRQWMIRAKLWRGKKQRVQQVHMWRPRRSRFGELVQWDTSTHDWLEGRGETIYLIKLIDDASSRLFARFVRSDSTAENMAVLREYLQRSGRPLEFYTDKASHFCVNAKKNRDPEAAAPDPTQIQRALAELNIGWIPAHSPQAKGRVERSFETAQDRLVKGLRIAGATTLEQANAYLEAEYLPQWEDKFTVLPACSDDAHRQLARSHDLDAILSHVEQRVVTGDYTIRFRNRILQIERADIRPRMRGARVRVEVRSNGQVAIRFENGYVRFAEKPPAVKPPKPVRRVLTGSSKAHNAGGKSKWMDDFLTRPGPSLGQAIGISNARS